MKIVMIMIAGLSLLAFSALAQDPATSPAVSTEMSCDDFTPTTEAQRRFAELEGACEAIVDRGGKQDGRNQCNRAKHGGPPWWDHIILRSRPPECNHGPVTPGRSGTA